MRLLLLLFFALCGPLAWSQQIIDTGGPVELALSIEPGIPYRGREAELTLLVRNSNAAPFTFEAGADLHMAMFLSGSRGVNLAEMNPGIGQSAIAWPAMSVAGNESMELKANVIIRQDTDAAVMAQFHVSDLSTGDAQHVELRVEPQWPESNNKTTWSRFIVGLGIAVAIGLFGGYPLARIMWSRAGGGARGIVGAGAILVFSIMAGLILLLISLEEYRVLTAFKEAACTPTDRLMETVTTSNQAYDNEATLEEGRSYELYYRALVAVKLDLPQGQHAAIWHSGQNGSDASGQLDWAEELLEAFEPGASSTCWYDPDDRYSLALERSISWWFYLTIILILLGMRKIAALIARN